MPAPIVAVAAKRYAPKIIALLLAGSFLFALLGLSVLMVVLGGSQPTQGATNCYTGLSPEGDDGGFEVAPNVDAADLDNLNDEQLENASIIVNTGRELGVPEYGQIVAIAVSWQESTLTNVDYGDDAGPDSRGLFQQRDPWGPEADRTNPAEAARMFYTGGQVVPEIAGDGEENGLLDIEGWEEMSIGEAGQSVQGSADLSGSWYGAHEMLARKVVAEMGGSESVASQCGNGVAMTCEKTPWPEIEEGLTPDALRVIRCIHENFPQIETFGGVGDRPNNSDSDHPSGRAVDAMIPDYDTKKGNDLGWEIANWVKDNAPSLGVKYVIFDRKIWEVSAKSDEWTDYTHPSGGSDDTLDHRDHVHVSVYGSSAGQADQTGKLVPPITDPYTLTARWGETGPYWATHHTGLDFSVPSGTELFAVAAGTVTYTGYDSAYGNMTKIRIADDTEIWYCHQTEYTVAVGDVVAPSESIGISGATGNITGPHLHLEVRINGVDADPEVYFEERGVQLG